MHTQERDVLRPYGVVPGRQRGRVVALAPQALLLSSILWDPSTFRLSNESWQVSGLSPSSMSNQVEYKPEYYQYDPTRAVVLGVGLTSSHGGTQNMKVDVGFLR
jgi:hypothetical protein